MPGEFSAGEVGGIFDAQIQGSGQLVTVWRPGRSVSAGTPTEANPTNAGTTSALILFSQSARDQAMLAGINPDLAAEGFFLSTASALITQRAYVNDAAGRWWLVHSRPAVQQVSPTGPASGVVGVFALLVLQSEKPAGIP